MTVTALLKQIHLGSKTLNPDSNGYDYAQEHEKSEAALLAMCAQHLWFKDSYKAVCPRPVLIGEHHQKQMEVLHESLTAALVDIVQRWFSDEDARFPERMPVEPEEEDLLRWLEKQESLGNLAPFKDCLGSWRPDFLVEEHRCPKSGTRVDENFVITEINARYSFNGFMHETYGQRAIDDVLHEMDKQAPTGLVSATNADLIFEGLLDLFVPTRPLHLLKGDELGIDIYMFIDAVERRFGIRPRLITPAELRLIPDAEAKDGHRLCCVVKDQTNGAESTNGETDGSSTNGSHAATTLVNDAGETVEEIFQVGLELQQKELADMSLDMLHAISLRCFNDMRTVLLVHDKRMLGIVKQEVPGLVARGVLTPTQGAALDRGIVDTILAGSDELESLLQTSKQVPGSRLDYILKPIRGGKGRGIVFGDDLDDQEWTASLERLHATRGKIVPGISCVVQRKIKPRTYDVVLKASGEKVHYPLVGTYHVCNGRLLGLGTWRSSGGRIVAVSGGGSWICSVIRRPLN